MATNASVVCELLGQYVMAHSPLLETMQSLVLDNQWRLRKAYIDQIPELARLFGQQSFEDKLQAALFESLGDSVCAVRLAAINNIGKSAALFGPEWTCDKLLPLINTHETNQGNIHDAQAQTGFSWRVTMILTYAGVAEILSVEQ